MTGLKDVQNHYSDLKQLRECQLQLAETTQAAKKDRLEALKQLLAAVETGNEAFTSKKKTAGVTMDEEEVKKLMKVTYNLFIGEKGSGGEK